MKKILFLTDAWAPIPTANAVCAKNVADVLKQRGWKVYVSAFESESRQQSETIDGIHVEYIKPALPRQLITKSNYITKARQKKFVCNLGILLNRITRLVFLSFYPITSPLFAHSWGKRVTRQVNENDISTIVSVNAPLDSVAAAYFIKKNCPQVKWIVYYIDGGSNYGKEQSFLKVKKRLQKKAIKWENKVLSYADKIVVMEGHSEFYMSVLSESNLKRVEILNVPLFSMQMTQNKVQMSKYWEPSQKEIWTYMGTIREGFYNPEKLFDWFLKYCKTHNAELHLYGSTNMEDYLKKKCDGKHIFYHGVVAHERVDKILRDSDVLVYFRSERLDSVSGKFFEYLKYQKPIVYYGPKNDINWRQLEKYPLGTAIDCEAGEQTKSFCGFNNIECNISDGMLRSIYYKSTPEAFADVVESIEKE